MIKIQSVLLSVLSILVFACQSEKEPQVEFLPKHWKGYLQPSETINIPLNFELNSDNKDSSLTLINGSERLNYKLKSNAEGFVVRLTPYESELKFNLESGGIFGWWYNYAKGPNYKIRFNATSIIQPETTSVKNQFTQYETVFGKGENSYPAALLFKRKNEKLEATFKTETGDYRFLWGEQIHDSLWLACFDGSHAFLFTAKKVGDSLTSGIFYSGNHYTDTWNAWPNAAFKLTNADQLTKTTSENRFRFQLLKPDRSVVNELEDSLQNKVIIIQIMGTWCPNCKDETEFLNSIRKKYDPKKLAIIAGAFEYQKDTAEAFKRIENYKAAMHVGYPIYYGGSTNKKKVTEIFPDLDRVISYPTLTVLDKNGVAVLVHTGFNGPATDEYQEFTTSFIALLDSLTVN